MSNLFEFLVILLDDDKHLPEADINHPVLIESVAVSKGWEMHAPTPEGHKNLESVGQGMRIVVYIEDSELRRPHYQKQDLFLEQELRNLEPLLRSAAVAQAIRRCHKIGSSWIVW
jgi:hypothetical protein